MTGPDTSSPSANGLAPKQWRLLKVLGPVPGDAKVPLIKIRVTCVSRLRLESFSLFRELDDQERHKRVKQLVFARCVCVCVLVIVCRIYMTDLMTRVLVIRGSLFLGVYLPFYRKLPCEGRLPTSPPPTSCGPTQEESDSLDKLYELSRYVGLILCVFVIIGLCVFLWYFVIKNRSLDCSRGPRLYEV